MKCVFTVRCQMFITLLTDVAPEGSLKHKTCQTVQFSVARRKEK